LPIRLVAISTQPRAERCLAHGGGGAQPSALHTGGVAEVSSVSCASAGNCAAGGFYTDRSGQVQAFVASQT
jgi:hypothetical protein